MLCINGLSCLSREPDLLYSYPPPPHTPFLHPQTVGCTSGCKVLEAPVRKEDKETDTKRALGASTPTGKSEEVLLVVLVWE